jgi:hypothetical protein
MIAVFRANRIGGEVADRRSVESITRMGKTA